MKQLLFILTVVFVLLSCSGSSKAGKGDVDTAQVAAANPQISNPNPQTLKSPDGKLFDARIVKGGQVQVDINEELAKKMLEGIWTNNFSMPEDNIVEGVSNVVQILITPTDPEYYKDKQPGDWDPYLVMRTKDGHVAILSIRNTIFYTNQLKSSGPLSFISGVTNIRPDEDGYGAMADTPDGAVFVDNSGVVEGHYSLSPNSDDQLSFSSDWNIMIGSSDGREQELYFAIGTFMPAGDVNEGVREEDEEGFNVGVKHFVAKTDEGTFKITWEQTTDGGRYATFTEMPKNCPLMKNHKYTATVAD